MFKSVVASNFDAVALLRYGRFDESMALLRGAYVAIKEVGASTPMDFGQGVPISVASAPVDDCEGTLLCDKTGLALGTASQDLFKRAFVLEGPLASLEPTTENACICATVCLYNMALNMHLKGLTMGQSRFLRKTSAIYQKVFELVNSYSPEPADSLSSLLLATVLNLIACESELRGQNSTYKWKNLYKELYFWATQSVPNSFVLRQAEEIDFFTISVLLYTNENLIAAAAA